jgi:asparagine synthase (glutamine-hydrolysing)
MAEQSHRDQQPFMSPAGTFLMWDGRLDNRTQLRFERPRQTDTDLEIAASLLERSGTAGLGDMVGDWALALFKHYERTLVLAKDFLGARTLYYLHCDRFVAWSSLLEPLIASADKLTLCEEYLAGWLTGFPEANLTPYQEIRSVPPASFVRVTSHAAKVERYWEFRHEPIRLKSDGEYEDQFRALFFESVKRRLRSHAPVLAELSGGMDSSSIVCVADRLTATNGIHSIETISLFDDSEPNWNEKPFFTAVETQRSRTGFHLNVASDGRFLPERDGSFPATPAYGARATESQVRYSAFLSNGDFRVLLSGIGGDEFTGGVPSGIPELADLLST